MMSPLPNASAKPIAQYMIAAIEKLVRIFATTVPAFFWREKPISSSAKPACMKMTSSAASSTHVELIATESGSTPADAASVTSALATAGRTPRASTPPRSALPILRVVIAPPLGFNIAEEHRVTTGRGHCPRVEDFPPGFLTPGRSGCGARGEPLERDPRLLAPGGDRAGQPAAELGRDVRAGHEHAPVRGRDALDDPGRLPAHGGVDPAAARPRIGDPVVSARLEHLRLGRVAAQCGL